MSLGHERLDVYRLAIGYVAWVDEKADGLTGSHRSATDQWLCASQSVSLNIADGNGKTADADRRRNFENRIDPDSDSDLEGTKPQRSGGGDGIPPPRSYLSSQKTRWCSSLVGRS